MSVISGYYVFYEVNGATIDHTVGGKVFPRMVIGLAILNCYQMWVDRSERYKERDVK
jgi:hypothetical protein